MDIPLARTGDLCLIAQSLGSTPPGTLAFQEDLQARFGGNLTNILHLTIQRFTPSVNLSSDSIWEKLCDAVRIYMPIRVSGTGLRVLYSDFRNCHILKVEATADKDLVSMTNEVNEVIRTFGVAPHYTFSSNLITVLEDIEDRNMHSELTVGDPPEPLFTIDTLFFWRLIFPGRGEELKSVTF